MNIKEEKHMYAAYRSKCSTPTSSASSAPICELIRSNVFVVGDPSCEDVHDKKTLDGNGFCYIEKYFHRLLTSIRLPTRISMKSEVIHIHRKTENSDGLGNLL